jgi:hypothetical protein
MHSKYFNYRYFDIFLRFTVKDNIFTTKSSEDVNYVLLA